MSVAGRAVSSELIADLTPFVLLGAAAYALYYWVTNSDWVKSGAAAAVGQQISNAANAVLPRPVTLVGPIGKGPTGAYSLKSGTLIVPNADNNGTPQEYAPSAVVDGTGQSVQELRNQGYSDDDIAWIIQTYAKNPAAFGG